MTTTQTGAATRSEIPGLQVSAAEPLPFGGGALSIRAFLLERPQGNLLIYSTTELGSEGSILRDRGPIVRHYLGHHHEAMFMSEELARIEAPLVVHDADRAAVEGQVSMLVHSFSKRHFADPDFEVIPIPGHTPGATAYLWSTGDHRLLFTGDSLFTRDGEWVAAVLDSSDRSSYVESLELLAGLDFDVLVPWAVGTDSPPLVPVGPAEASARIGAIADRVRGGADG